MGAGREDVVFGLATWYPRGQQAFVERGWGISCLEEVGLLGTEPWDRELRRGCLCWCLLVISGKEF